MPDRRRFLLAALALPFPIGRAAGGQDGADPPAFPRDRSVVWNPRHPWVESVAGDRLFGRCRTFDGEAFLLELARDPPRDRNDPGVLRLPAERVRAVKLADRLPLDTETRLRLLRERGEEDLIFSPAGVERGTLLAIDGDAVRVAGAAGEVRFPRPAVRACGLAPSLLARPPVVPGRFGVLLGDGSFFRAAAAADEAGGFLFDTAFGPLTISESRIAGVTVDEPGTAPLSVAAYRHVPLIGGEVPVRRDRTVAGGVCVAGGRPRPWGLGVPSGSMLTGPVPPSADEFAATFAVDAAAGPRAGVSVRVTVDGAVRFAVDGVGAGSVRAVRVPIAGAASVSLGVGYGVNGDVRDFAFWERPRFS